MYEAKAFYKTSQEVRGKLKIKNEKWKMKNDKRKKGKKEKDKKNKKSKKS